MTSTSTRTRRLLAHPAALGSLTTVSRWLDQPPAGFRLRLAVLRQEMRGQAHWSPSLRRAADAALTSLEKLQGDAHV